jgi:uncharacterized repeat protein (TIGR03806 family)
MRALVAVAALAFMAPAVARVSDQAPVNQAAISAERPPETLSAYRFFRDIAAREPNAGVTPYDLNTPLWSDGALKFRYVFVPPGQSARYNSARVFEFPVGTVLIKTFAFAADMRQPRENVRLLETRLLIRRADGWIALPYVWNEEQTEARLSPIGAVVPVSFIDADGEALALDWDVPNRNQCKGCHDRNGDISPIGPSARNLNRAGDDVSFSPWDNQGNNSIPRSDPISTNQLDAWVHEGLLAGAPNVRDAPRVPDAFDPASGTVHDRARAYLDVNCAHCHNPEGPAHTSGLDLSWSQTNPAQWGVYKRPVAAGRASAGFAFSIEPSHPERSILVHRMASNDPGVMMPELGRQLVDERAVALMREWIAGMPRDPQAPN